MESQALENHVKLSFRTASAYFPDDSMREIDKEKRGELAFTLRKDGLDKTNRTSLWDVYQDDFFIGGACQRRQIVGGERKKKVLFYSFFALEDLRVAVSLSRRGDDSSIKYDYETGLFLPSFDCLAWLLEFHNQRETGMLAYLLPERDADWYENLNEQVIKNQFVLTCGV